MQDINSSLISLLTPDEKDVASGEILAILTKNNYSVKDSAGNTIVCRNLRPGVMSPGSRVAIIKTPEGRFIVGDEMMASRDSKIVWIRG